MKDTKTLKPYKLKGYLKDYRRQYNLSQDALAEHIGVSRITLVRWENEQVKKISTAWLKILISLGIIPKNF